ncbi:hypothetical protein [Microtetraspora malaysiensis]|uniref:hypothetical protein n=1 Tax=Microtetraspora malaysiensis TaxID=161358 RepID=UPI003D8B641B
MGYDLHAVIANTEPLRRMCAELPNAKIALLRQGLSLLPITDELFDAVADREAEGHPDFWRLPNGFDLVLARWSHVAPVAYVEAEYFGGVGEQCAAVWRDGHLILGPLKVGEMEPSPPEGTPISQALRTFGAHAHGAHDEFDAVGLDAHRDTNKWIS